MYNLVFLNFLVASIVWGAASALAQDVSSSGVPGCRRENSSRLPAPGCGDQPGPPVTINSEVKISTTIIIPELQTNECEAEVSLQYTQLNTIARINGTIENEMCAASSGSFVVSIRTMDSNHAVKMREFTQTWLREDDQIVTFNSDYHIGEDVDLVRVRTLDVRCKCTVPENTE